jgi:DNA-binding NtrC family response regulator
MEPAARVLLAEDDTDLRALLAAELRRGGLDVVECANGLELVEMLDRGEGDFDALVTDIRMPGVTGMEVLEGLNVFGKRCPVVLITAFGDEETHARAKRMGAALVLDKPFDARKLLGEVVRLIDRRRRWSEAWKRSGEH